MNDHLTRRAFLRSALGSSLAISGVTAMGGLTLFPGSAHAVAKSTVGVARNTTPEAMARAALAALGGMEKFVSRGENVIVKPNIGWDRTPALAANTDPEVVRAVVSMCLEAGAKKVTVMDRPCNDPRRCYKRSGIQDAIASLGNPAATLEHMDSRKFVDVPMKDSTGSITSWTYYKDVLEADKVINVPVAKHHNATRLTMSLKNVMGLLGGNRGNIHHALDENIAELNLAFRFDLHVLDAVRILTSHVPRGGAKSM